MPSLPPTAHPPRHPSLAPRPSPNPFSSLKLFPLIYFRPISLVDLPHPIHVSSLACLPTPKPPPHTPPFIVPSARSSCPPPISSMPACTVGLRLYPVISASAGSDSASTHAVLCVSTAGTLLHRGRSRACCARGRGCTGAGVENWPPTFFKCGRGLRVISCRPRKLPGHV
jgi:hypothetical protein